MLTGTIRLVSRSLFALLFFTVCFIPLFGQEVPSPTEFFGFEPGTNYKLIDNGQLEEYYRTLSETSERVLLREIGETHRGRTLLLLMISSEENLARLDDYREISERLAHAKDLSDDEARQLAEEGKAVVWIDSGLHSPELAHSQHNPEFAYHMATDESPETRKMRDEVILLNMPMMNPDGHDIVVDWYREQRGTEFELTRPPRVYHEYIGHDNNRDWYMLLQNESKAVADVLYNEWYPQIVLNHHQMGEMPARMFIPPFADPVNPNIPAMAIRGTNLVGEHMANRFAAEGKSGIIQGITFNMWWNGGMRTVPYFHNMVGILTESTHSSPVPRKWDEEDIPDHIVRGSNVISMKNPSVFYPDPWKGGWSSMRQMVEYHMTASLGVMDIAEKRKQEWLYNIYQMGRNAIEAGAENDPYAYVISPNQWDRAEAIEMLKVLQRGGIDIQRATSGFKVDETSYPAGSYVIYTGQAFRPYLIDLMEPQSYPDRRLYPDGPPEPPYDMAGWTLPIQMGVDVKRLTEPFEIDTEWAEEITPFPGSIRGSGRAGFLISPTSNMADVLAVKLLNDGYTVHRLTEAIHYNHVSMNAGAFFVEQKNSGMVALMRQYSREYGLNIAGLNQKPEVNSIQLNTPNIAMYQSWTSPMDEGWTRWIFDHYGFDYTTLHNADIRQGNLNGYDLIILPSMSADAILNGHEHGTMPKAYTGGVGLEGALQLKQFVENGGTILAWEGATDFLIEQFGLPIRNSLKSVDRQDFFIPGSLVQIETDNSHPHAFGVQKQHAAFFLGQSRAFSVVEPAKAEDRVGEGPAVEVISRYSEEAILLSGWALGEDQYLSGKPAALRAGLGEGEMVLIGFRPQLRAQPRATFKFLFNTIFSASADGVPAIEPWKPAE